MGQELSLPRAAELTSVDSGRGHDEHGAMTRPEALPLRCALVALAVVALLAQVALVPAAARGYARAFPEVAYLASPYAAAIVVAIACFEVSLLAAWQLLSAALMGRGSTGRFRRWADVSAMALVCSAVVLAAVCLHAGSIAGVGGPAMLFGLLASAAVVPAAFILRRAAIATGIRVPGQR